MKVNVMGTSCTWFTRNNTSFVIDDEMFLDVPEGAYKNLIQVADLEKLKCIFISATNLQRLPNTLAYLLTQYVYN